VDESQSALLTDEFQRESDIFSRLIAGDGSAFELPLAADESPGWAEQLS